jgi:hypothetical protein
MYDIIFVVALILVAFLLGSTWPSRGFPHWRSRARRSATFLTELIPDDGRVLFCACLQGNVARYLIEYGLDNDPCFQNVGGPMCLNCARAEFVAWCLSSRPLAARDNAEHRRLLSADDEDRRAPAKRQAQP